MDKGTMLLLFLTFLVGIFTGAYLYVMVFAPMYKTDVASADKVDPNATVIDGQVKGHCLETSSCASFRISSDGSYNYLPNPAAKVEHGILPDTITQNVFATIKTQKFFNDTKQLSYNACAQPVRTTGFSYTVSFNGMSYILDTCITNFANDTAFQTTLGNVWIYLANPTAGTSTAQRPALFQKGLLGYFFELFNNAGTTTHTTSY